MGEEFKDDIFIENTDELYNLGYSSNKEGRPIYENVKVTKKDFSIFELFRKFKAGKLILEVDFQRNVVWNNKQQSELIESILMGLPLPIFYFKQQDNSTYVVVDGKQRLSTLFLFLNNGFQLKNLKILDFLNGKKFKDLDNQYGIYQSQLEDYQVYSHVILPPTPDRIVFDIFERVNRGGTQLNKQEIRNALYHGEGLGMINAITTTEEFQRATRIDNKKDKRMKGSYLLTRFFSFYLLYNNYFEEGKQYQYTGDIDLLIERTLIFLNKSDISILNKLKETAIESIKKAYFLCGNGCFRKGMIASNPINMNIFETCMYLMTLIEDNNSLLKIKDVFYETLCSQKFLECIGDSRDGIYKVNLRFQMMNEIARRNSDDF